MRQVTAIALLLLGRLRRRLIPLAVLALTACLLGSTAGRVLAQADTPVRLVLVIASEGEGDKSAVSLANWLSSRHTARSRPPPRTRLRPCWTGGRLRRYSSCRRAF